MSYIYLSLAILAEVIATTSLKYSEEFSRLVPSIIVACGYLSAFYFLTLSLRELNLGIAYAIWAGVGILAISLIQVFWFREILDLPALIGIALIIAGVVVINVFSTTVKH